MPIQKNRLIKKLEKLDLLKQDLLNNELIDNNFSSQIESLIAHFKSHSVLKFMYNNGDVALNNGDVPRNIDEIKALIQSMRNLLESNQLLATNTRLNQELTTILDSLIDALSAPLRVFIRSTVTGFENFIIMADRATFFGELKNRIAEHIKLRGFRACHQIK